MENLQQKADFLKNSYTDILTGLDAGVPAKWGKMNVQQMIEHMSEYVGAYAQRLAWLTGFGGSAGTAVVLADRAAIFVDGRYTLQVRQETDPAAYEHAHLVDEPPALWVERHGTAGLVLGVDPWLHTRDELERLGALVDAGKTTARELGVAALPSATL